MLACSPPHVVLSSLFASHLLCLQTCSIHPSDRQSKDDWRDGRKHSKGHGDVNESVEAVLWNSSLRKGKAVQRHQSWVQSYEIGASRQETCLSRAFFLVSQCAHKRTGLCLEKKSLTVCFAGFRLIWSIGWITCGHGTWRKDRETLPTPSPTCSTPKCRSELQMYSVMAKWSM